MLEMHTLPECTAPVASPLKPLPTENFYQSNIHVSGTTLAARHMIQINRDTPEMRRQLGSDPLLAKRKLKRSSKSFGYAFVTFIRFTLLDSSETSAKKGVPALPGSPSATAIQAYPGYIRKHHW